MHPPSPERPKTVDRKTQNKLSVQICPQHEQRRESPNEPFIIFSFKLSDTKIYDPDTEQRYHLTAQRKTEIVIRHIHQDGKHDPFFPQRQIRCAREKIKDQ